LVLEALEAEQEAWVRERSQEVEQLPGRVRVRIEELAPIIPSDLEDLFLSERVGLVVHSGPPEEVAQLLEMAQRERSAGAATQILLVSPQARAQQDVLVREFFPAAALFSRAAFVVTGGGYNSVAEGRALASRFLGRPFPRKWDDQAARLRESGNLQEPTESPINGLGRAAEVLAGWYRKA
jgi:hypothetical protein